MLQVAEALDPFKTVPISMSNIYKVVDNLHMLWMCIYIHIFNVMMTFAMAKQFVPRVLACLSYNPQCYVVFAALEEFRMTPASMSNTYIRWSTTFICCGYDNECILTMIPPLSSTKLFELD